MQCVRTDLDHCSVGVPDIIKQLLDEPIGPPADMTVPIFNRYWPVIVMIGGASMPHWLTTKEARLFWDRV